MNKEKDFNSKIAFAVGTGRCGTKFLSKVFELESRVASCHERNPLNEAFHRYCKWYGLPVDNEGFLYTKELEIANDFDENDFSFEASPHLSLSVKELFERFKCKFILMVRSPEKVVNSYKTKGVYENSLVRTDVSLPPGNQPALKFHQFLGRIVPLGDEGEKWEKMTQIGKLAWWWKTINLEVLNQFKDIPESYWCIEKLEDMNYHRFLEVSSFLGINAAVNEEKYNSIVASKPNALPNVPSVKDWSLKEIAEFEGQVAQISEQLGYEYQVKNLN